jgi:hypothetical protein
MQQLGLQQQLHQQQKCLLVSANTALSVGSAIILNAHVNKQLVLAASFLHWHRHVCQAVAPTCPHRLAAVTGSSTEQNS